MSDTERLLTLLCDERPDGEYVEVARINGGAPVVHMVEAVADAIAFVKATPEGYDQYFASATRRAKGKKHATEAGVASVLGASVDADGGVSDFDDVFPPSIIVESGGLTADLEPRVQAFWLFREPFAIESAQDRARIRAINVALAHRYGGDSTHSLDHLFRLPGTFNYCKRADGTSKVPAGVETPRMAQIADWHPERRYEPSDLEDFLGLDGSGELPADPVHVAFGDADFDAERVLQECIDAGISDETADMIVEGTVADGGTRHQRDYSVIGRLLEDVIGITDDEIRALFQAFAIGDRYAEKGQGDRYLALSIGKARAAHPPADDDDDDDDDVNVVEPRHAAPEARAPRLPEIAWEHPFGVYRGAVEGSTEAADEHHFAAFRSIAGAYLGRAVRVHYGRAHYAADYALLIGPTHDKKTTAQRRAQDFAALLSPTLGTLGALSSAEGLIEWLARQDMTASQLGAFVEWMQKSNGEPWVYMNPMHRRGLLISEEFAGVLVKARQDGSSQLVTTITQLYDQPDVVEPPLRTRRIVAERPTFSILGASTPDWIVKNLKEADIMGGFANRFMYFTGPAKEPMPWPPKPDGGYLEEVAAHLEKKAVMWSAGVEFTLHPHARELWDTFYIAWANRQRDEGDLPTSKLESRIPEHAIKLSLLYAALGSTVPIIGPHYMEAAIAVAGYLKESVRFAFADTLDTGETPAMKLERAVVRVLQDGPIKKRDLSRRAKQRNTTAADFARCIDGLVKARQVLEDVKAGTVRLRND